MATPTQAVPSTNANASGSFPVPFTREAFQPDVVNVFFFYVRTIGLMTNEKTAWAITGAPTPKDLFVPEDSAADVGLAYEHIRSTELATTMEHLYEYAYYGRVDASDEALDTQGGITAFVSAIVADAMNGHVANEWDGHGAITAGRHCYAVAELANARVVLEGGEPFYVFSAGPKDDAGGFDSLTVRQMALLADMEEMSIRSAANPKRANALKTYSDEGGTRIARDVAKAWLQSKGRYVPITRYWTAGEIDLAKRRFANATDLCSALDARIEMHFARSSPARFAAKLTKIGLNARPGCITLEESHFGDEALMRALAAALDLPADLLVLRARETLAIQTLAKVEKQLREVTQSHAINS